MPPVVAGEGPPSHWLPDNGLSPGLGAPPVPSPSRGSSDRSVQWGIFQPISLATPRRRIIGLFHFGYVRASHEHEAKLGIVFGPHNDTSAKAATFTSCLTSIGWVFSAANIRNMMDPSVAYANFRMPA
jgi:hypothetical protein